MVEDTDEADEVDSSSDLNTRDEMGDLESCPEGVGQSASLSGNDGDLQLKAELITEELLQLILKDYKEDAGFDVNAT